MCPRVAEINQNSVAHVLGDKAIEFGYRSSDGVVIGGDDLAQILGIESSGELGRADQIAEHHRQLPTLGGGRRSAGGSRAPRVKRSDSVEKPPAMPDQGDPEILEILGC